MFHFLSLLPMATIQKKNKKTKKAGSSKLKLDKVEKVEVKKLIHDERSHKIVGTILILIAFLLFIAFTSYLFTWQQDQSKVLQGAKILLPSHDQQMGNALGTAALIFLICFFAKDLVSPLIYFAFFSL